VQAIAGGMARATIRKLVRADRFPRPLNLGIREWRWSRASIEAWAARLETVTAPA
jgi:predicted DNA-binding transcriptional regulator AlpA